MQFSPNPPHLRASFNLTPSEIHQKAARALETVALILLKRAFLVAFSLL